ncbi:MAG: type 1 periplasmic binding fold superfamily protein [Bacteroidota bacterium]|nr:type 1 periplasmic binding fold superfamily protein [Bacteroidota bacterium]
MKSAGLYAILIAAMLITGCKKEEPDPATPPPPVNEEEVFTTVILRFVNNEPGVDETFTLRYTDLDGDGGQAPILQLDTIRTQRYFDLSIELWNESVSPAVNLTGQIQSEGTDHQIFFQNEVPSLMITYDDQDPEGAPIGLNNIAQTGVASNGTLRVTLRHGPDKNASGVADGDITNAGGDTDVEVEFPVIVF